MSMNWKSGLKRVTLVLSIIGGLSGLLIWIVAHNAKCSGLKHAEIQFQNYTDKIAALSKQDSLPLKVGPWNLKWGAKTEDDSLPPGNLSLFEFAQIVKVKYPDYRDINAEELAKRVLKKYPVYRKYIKPEERFDPDQYLEEKGIKLTETDFGIPLQKEYCRDSNILGSVSFSVGAFFPWIIFLIGSFIVQGFKTGKKSE